MTGLDLLVLLLFIVSVILFVISLAVPNPRLFQWSFGFLLGAFAALAWGSHLIH